MSEGDVPQTTAPPVLSLMNLNWTVVPAGRETLTLQELLLPLRTRGTPRDGLQFPRAGTEPTSTMCCEDETVADSVNDTRTVVEEGGGAVVNVGGEGMTEEVEIGLEVAVVEGRRIAEVDDGAGFEPVA